MPYSTTDRFIRRKVMKATNGRAVEAFEALERIARDEGKAQIEVLCDLVEERVRRAR